MQTVNKQTAFKLIGMMIIFILALWSENNCADNLDSALKNSDVITILKEKKAIQFLGQNTEICKDFLNDSRTFLNFEIITPTFATDNFNDERIREINTACPRIDLRKSYYISARGIGFPDEPVDTIKSYADIFEGLNNYQMYEVDINNNVDDGKEKVFYYENERNIKTGLVTTTRTFKNVDTTACKTRTIYSFNSFMSEKWSKNSIVKYKNKIGILQLRSNDNSEPDYTAYIFSFFDSELNMDSCAYRLRKK